MEVHMACRLRSRIALAMLLLAPLSICGVAQSQIKPSDPIAGILEAFKTRQVVGIPDAHRNTATHAFLLSLIRDSRFPAVVNDVVVECGNALHQDVADRFVRAENVPYEALRKIWLDTTQAQPGCDTPQPEETLRTVRAVNASLGREQQIRLLLGDPPIRWEEVKTKADHRKWIEMREIFPAEIVQREVLTKHRKALLVYGVGHLWRKNPQANFESSGLAASVVSLLEETHGTRVFNVGLAFDLERERPYVASWPAPSLVVLRGTDLGATAVAYDGPRVSVQSGQIVPVPRDQWRSMSMQDQYDALLYLGPRTSWSYAMVSPALCADPTYVEMRTGRMALAEWKSDQLDDYCGKVQPPAK
jgi:hypothetical protein